MKTRILLLFAILIFFTHFGAASEIKNDSGQSKLDNLLIKAAENGALDIATQLVEMGAKTIYSPKWSALHYASFRQDINLFKLLVKSAISLPQTLYESKTSEITIANAALIGGRHYNIPDSDTLNFLKYLVANRVDIDHQEDTTPGRFVAMELGYGEDVLSLFTFPPVRPALPEIDLKQVMKKGDWKIVQKQLAQLGLYEGPIDGVSGPKTRKSAYSYYAAFFDEMAERAQIACEIGKSAALADKNHYYRLNKKMDEIIGIRYVPISNQKGHAIYSGYRCNKIPQTSDSCQEDHRFCESEYDIYTSGNLHVRIAYYHLNKWSKKTIYADDERGIKQAVFYLHTNPDGTITKFYGAPWVRHGNTITPTLWGQINE